MRSIIAETSHVTAISQDLGGDAVVIVFNEMNLLRNGDRFWEDGFFLKQGISSIGVVTSTPNWYPRLAMEELIPKIREAIGGRRVVTYGYGQGGYGALKFSGLLGADVALSFCPQWSINPADVQAFDGRYRAFFDANLGNGRKIEAGDICGRSYIFCDPRMRADFHNAREIARFKGAVLVPCPFTGHDPVRLVTESGIAVDLIRSALGGPSDGLEGRPRSLIRVGRKSSKTYIFQLKSHFLRRAKVSHAFPSALLDKYPGPEDGFMRAAVSFLDGNTPDAEILLDNMQAAEISKLSFFQVWSLSRELSFKAGELLIGGHILAKNPNDLGLCLLRVNSFLTYGMHAEAKDELNRLAALEGAGKHADGFIRFAKQLQDCDVLQSLSERPMDTSSRVRVLFAMAEMHAAGKRRQPAIKTMLAISQICGDSVDDLAKLHELAKRMADQAFARDIANRLSLIEPANVLFKIQVIDGTVRADRTEQDKGFAELNRLIRSYPMTASCWECASHAYEAMQRPDEALAAIGEAIELSRDAQLKVRQVKLLLRAGDTRKARNRIAEISVDRTDRPAAIRDLSDLALRCGSEEAALGFAKTQYDLEPENPDAILCLAKCLRATGDKTGATALLAPLLKRSQEAEILSARQRIVMTQELIGAERSTLANQAALGVLARQPDNLVAKRYVMTFDREQQSADAPAAEAANTTRTPWSPLRFLKTKLAGRRGK